MSKSNISPICKIGKTKLSTVTPSSSRLLNNTDLLWCHMFPQTRPRRYFFVYLQDLWEKGRRCGYPRYSVRRLGKIVETATQCASVISSLTAPFTEPEENEDDFDAGIEELDDERNALALPDSRSTPRKHIKESKQLGTPKKDPNELPSGPIVTKVGTERCRIIGSCNNLICTGWYASIIRDIIKIA